jgi:hypothetical protein
LAFQFQKHGLSSLKWILVFCFRFLEQFNGIIKKRRIVLSEPKL